MAMTSKKIKARLKQKQISKKLGDSAVKIQQGSSKHVRRYITNRSDRLKMVRRFTLSWLLLIIGVCLSTLGTTLYIYRNSQIAAATEGGTYTEGMVGTLNNMNPLFGTGVVSQSSNKLLFSGLMKYAEDRTLKPDIAKSVTIDSSGKTYKVYLRDDVKWHDGKRLTSADVAYTISTIQNPSANAVEFASWKGIAVTVVNDFEINFQLPAPFAPFINSLTQPIVPKHLLDSTQANRLRNSSFNAHPVGSGPFVFQALRNNGRQQQLELVKNEEYYGVKPKLNRFVIKTYSSDTAMANDLSDRKLSAATDLKSVTSDRFVRDRSIRLANMSLNSGVFAFFKTTTPRLSDPVVRAALAEAVDRQSILDQFSGRYAPLKTALLPNQTGYDATYDQKTDLTESKKLLDSAGWVMEDGTRRKNSEKLELSIVTLDNAEYIQVANLLKDQWEKIGVETKIQPMNAELLQQNALGAHSYDILLYGIAIGSDPDVYAYWHSSQARQGGFNFSEWSSPRADTSLEYGRTRLDTALRTARYSTFMDEWKKQTPAVALYRPQVIYAYHQNVEGLSLGSINSIADRLNNVSRWSVNTKNVNRTP